jgi:hypothetical protein
MYPTSSAFKTAVRNPHNVTIRAEVWRSGVFLRSLNVIEGQVDIDARRAQRRTARVKIAATRPTFDYEPIWNVYASIKTSAGGPYSTYGAFKTAFPFYGATKLITGYDEVSVDAGLIPDTAFSDLAPFGNELLLWRGIEVDAAKYRTYASLKPTGTYADLKLAFTNNGAMTQPYATEVVNEEVPLGVFVMTEVNIEDTVDGTTMEIVGVDRSLRIQKAKWVDPYVISNGSNLATTVRDVLSNRWSDVDTSGFETTIQTVPTTTLGLRSGRGGDPWADAQRIATAGGFDLYFNSQGVAVLSAVSDPSEQTPVATYVEGDEAMVLSVQRRISSDETFNGVVVSGEGSNIKPPVRATLFDEDPASPTYRYGTFGDRPTFLSSSLLSSASAAAVVAAAELSKLKGAEENVDWSQIVDPSLDAGDVIQIVNTGSGLNKVLVLDKLTIPLKPSDAMRATARTVRVLSDAS